MLAALGRSTELKGHVRGALNNGASLVENCAKCCCTARCTPARRRRSRRFAPRVKC